MTIDYELWILGATAVAVIGAVAYFVFVMQEVEENRKLAENAADYAGIHAASVEASDSEIQMKLENIKRYDLSIGQSMKHNTQAQAKIKEDIDLAVKLVEMLILAANDYSVEHQKLSRLLQLEEESERKAND